MGSIFSYATAGLKSNNTVGKIGLMGAAGGLVDGAITYNMRQSENPEESKAVSGMMAAGSAAMWMFAEPLMWGITAGQVGKFAVEQGIQEAYKNRETRSDATRRNGYELEGTSVRGKGNLKQGNIGGDFTDSERAATLRQRQMESMRTSRMQTENILSSTSRELHR